jgi:hypothetical protein
MGLVHVAPTLGVEESTRTYTVLLKAFIHAMGGGLDVGPPPLTDHGSGEVCKSHHYQRRIRNDDGTL